MLLWIQTLVHRECLPLLSFRPGLELTVGSLSSCGSTMVWGSVCFGEVRVVRLGAVSQNDAQYCPLLSPQAP